MDTEGLKLDIESVQAQYLKSSAWYERALESLADDLRAVRPRTAFKLGKSIVRVRSVIRSKYYNVQIPMDAALACVSGSRPALNALSLKFVDTFYVAMALRNRVGSRRCPPTSTIESMLIRELVFRCKDELAMLAISFSRVLQRLLRADPDDPALAEAGRLTAMVDARKHALQAYRAGVSRQDWLDAFDQAAADSIMKYKGLGHMAPLDRRRNAMDYMARVLREERILKTEQARQRRRKDARFLGRRTLAMLQDRVYVVDEIEGADADEDSKG